MNEVLWGPLNFALDGAPDNQILGWVLTLLLFGMVLLFPFRPRPWSALLAAFAAGAWLCLGIIGAGINV